VRKQSILMMHANAPHEESPACQRTTRNSSQQVVTLQGVLGLLVHISGAYEYERGLETQ